MAAPTAGSVIAVSVKGECHSPRTWKDSRFAGMTDAACLVPIHVAPTLRSAFSCCPSVLT
jgi:hypothetical protein